MSDSANPRFTDEETSQLCELFKNQDILAEAFEVYEKDIKNANLPDDYPSYLILFLTDCLDNNDDDVDYFSELKAFMWCLRNATRLAGRGIDIVPPSVNPDVACLESTFIEGALLGVTTVFGIFFDDEFETFKEFISSRVNTRS